MLTEAEFETRRQGIDGSDVGAILGSDPFASAFSVYAEKIGHDPRNSTIFDRRRAALEALASALYGERADLYGERSGWLQRIPQQKHNWQIASIDRVISWPGVELKTDGRVDEYAKRLVQIECPGSRHQGVYGPEMSIDPLHVNRVVPYHHVCRCIWSMLVTGVRECDLAVLLDGELRIYPIDWNAHYAATLESGMQHFWEDHVLARRPPEMDGKGATSEALERLYAEEKPGKILPPTPRVMAAVAAYTVTRSTFRQMEEALEKMRNEVVSVIGDAEGIDGVCTYKGVSGGIDWKAVAEELYDRSRSRESLDLIAKRHELPRQRHLIFGGT
jgi:predicted phage-related endonuclease